MTNEELERQIEFIIGQQAQFAADMQQLRESMQQLNESQARTDQLVNRLAAATLEGFKDVNAKIDALVDSHIRLADAQQKLSETQAQMQEQVKNILAVMDRYFRERNGRAES